LNLHLDIGNSSDVGKVREVNEDYFASFNGSFGSLLIVCDGMGGHKGGDIASRIAVETIKNHFKNLGNNYNIPDEIRISLETANDSIIQKAKEDAELSDMGSTVVLVLIKDGLAYYASLGDSRIYRIRDGKIQQITKDNSLVQQMVDSELITEDEAKIHPKKNVITKALGINDKLEPEIYEPFKLLVNDKLILCSDGLTAHVDDEEIFQLAESNSPQEAAQKLVDLANERGGTDNITVQIASVSVNEPERKNNNSNNYLSYTILLIAVVALALVLIKFEVISFGGKAQNISKTDNSDTRTKQQINQNNSEINNNVRDTVKQKPVNTDSLNTNNEEATNDE
jgi:PPM family protein phosphatase